MGRSGGGGGRSSGSGSSGSRSSGASRSSGGFGGSRSSGGFSGGGRSSGGSASRPSRPSGGSTGRTSGGGGFGSSHSSSSRNSGGSFFGSGNDRRHEHEDPYRHPYHERTRTVFVPVPTQQPDMRAVRSSTSNTGGSKGGKTGCLVFLIIILLLALVLSVSGGSDKQKNTTERTALSGQVNKTQWYQDDLNWISNKQVLIDGLEDFYKKTGIQPYVLLRPYDAGFWNADGSCNAEAMDAYLQKVYDETFTDEAHFIFAYFSAQNDSKSEMEGEFRYVSGYSADTIMDSEAVKILWGYFEENYYDTSLSLESMIADTFSDTGERIMSRPTNAYDAAVILIRGAIVIALLVCIVRIFQVVAKRRREREEYNQRILETPLETFDTGIDTADLEKKYEEERPQDQKK